jgi:hypothetical protein
MLAFKKKKIEPIGLFDTGDDCVDVKWSDTAKIDHFCLYTFFFFENFRRFHGMRNHFRVSDDGNIAS